MRRTRPTLLIAVGAAIILAAIAAIVFTFLRGPDEDRFGPIVLATAVDPNSGEPTAQVEWFQAGSTKLYAALAVRDVEAGDSLDFRWQASTDEAPIETRFTATRPLKRQWVYSELELEEGVEPGDYSVEVRRGSDVVERREFKVTD